MGFCGGCCKVMVTIWSIIGMLMSLAVVGWMAFKINGLTEEQASPVYPLMEEVMGTGWYQDVSLAQLHKYCWYAALGLATLMSVALIVHVISTCKSSRCLLSLSTLLLVVVLAADIVGLVFRYEVLNTMNENLVPSLNSTIVNKYGESIFITEAWNTFNTEEASACCGVNGIEDFKYSKHVNLTTAGSESVCKKDTQDRGCEQFIRNGYVNLHDIWFTTLIAAKAALAFLVLFHTCYVCKYGFKSAESRGYADVESYSLQRKK